MKILSRRWIIYLSIVCVISACAAGGKSPRGNMGQKEMEQNAVSQDFDDSEAVSNIREDTPPGHAILKLEARAHLSVVFDLCGDKDFKYLLSASKDKTLRLWDRSTGRLIQTYRVPMGEGNDGVLLACAMSPDGNYVYGAGWTGWDWNKKASIYVFDRENGRLVRRITDIDERVDDLAISQDGRLLGAALQGRAGIRVWSINEGYKLLFTDSEYKDKASSIDFDNQGRLVTASNDGNVRLYDTNFKQIKKVKAPLGGQVGSAAFSPDGSKIAIGYKGAINVSVLNGETLEHLFDPSTSGLASYALDGVGLGIVAWSPDSEYLYASGSAFGGNEQDKKRVVRRWSKQGLGQYQDYQISPLPVKSLLTLDKGEVVYATIEPNIGILDQAGKLRLSIANEIPDFRGLRKFRVSADGKMVQFGLSLHDSGSVRFDLAQRKILFDQSNGDVELPVRHTSNIQVKRWKKKFNPILNGRVLVSDSNDRSHAIAIAPDESRLVIGLSKTLRMFDANGKQLWMRYSPGVTWNVNISGDGQYVIALFGDGTIRWFQLNDGKELLAVFVYKQGREWVAWTPHGFFDASPGAEKYIGFHLNRGQDQEPAFVTIDQLYDHFYHPDLIAKALDKNNQQELIDARAKVDINQILFGGLPPKISLLSANGEITTDQEQFTVRVCVNVQSGGIGKIIYRINNLTLGLDDMAGRGLVRNKDANVTGPEELCDYLIERTMVLEPGPNNISVSAFNKDNKIESKAAGLDITYSGSRTSDEKPNLHIIAVGINQYRDSALQLKYSVPDANAFVETMQVASRGLFNNIVVHKILDGDATINGIGDTFKQVSTGISPNDVFIFYIAAHGITINGRYFIIPQNLIYQNDESVENLGLGQDQLQKMLASIPAAKSIVLLDTCNSGAYITANSRGLAEKTAFNKLMRATGRVTLAASAGNQEALEGYQGHGVFTFTLLQALSGLADKKGNNDGQISINELAEFIGDQVPKITLQKWGKEQFPMQSLQGRSFPIALTK